MRAAFIAARRREALPRRRAATLACAERLRREPAEWPSRRSCPKTARERTREVARFRDFWPLRLSRFACCRTLRETFPRAGTGKSTPALRALESPMAIAWFADRAPCFPSRIWCISSRTNSPACVLGDFPSRLSCSAFRITSSSGISHHPVQNRSAAMGNFQVGQTAKVLPGCRVQSLPGGRDMAANGHVHPWSLGRRSRAVSQVVAVLPERK